MGISEFTVHNVLRTYSRQEHLGRVQRAKPRGAPPVQTADQVSLSTSGQKVQWLGQFAAEIVDRQHPNTIGEERTERVRSTKDELLGRHGEEVGDDRMTPEAFAYHLRSVYLG